MLRNSNNVNLGGLGLAYLMVEPINQNSAQPTDQKQSSNKAKCGPDLSKAQAVHVQISVEMSSCGLDLGKITPSLNDSNS